MSKEQNRENFFLGSALFLAGVGVTAISVVTGHYTAAGLSGIAAFLGGQMVVDAALNATKK